MDERRERCNMRSKPLLAKAGPRLRYNALMMAQLAHKARRDRKYCGRRCAPTAIALRADDELPQSEPRSVE